MSAMQIGPRLLLSQKNLATMTITRFLQSREKLEIRKRRLQAREAAEQEIINCYKALRRTENRCNQPRLQALHDECLDECDQGPLPMDLDNYTPSDKNRKYQRTWCETYVLPKRFVSQTKNYPKRPRRKLSRKSGSGECVEFKTVDADRRPPEQLIPIKHMGKWPCCKIKVPGCPKARAPPSCEPSLVASCCKKRRTQYPSFSECQTEGLLDPIPPCECARTASLCEVWAYWRRTRY